MSPEEHVILPKEVLVALQSNLGKLARPSEGTPKYIAQLHILKHWENKSEVLYELPIYVWIQLLEFKIRDTYGCPKLVSEGLASIRFELQRELDTNNSLLANHLSDKESYQAKITKIEEYIPKIHTKLNTAQKYMEALTNAQLEWLENNTEGNPNT